MQFLHIFTPSYIMQPFCLSPLPVLHIIQCQLQISHNKCWQPATMQLLVQLCGTFTPCKKKRHFLSLACTRPLVFPLQSLSTAYLSFRGQVLKALQSKQGMENGPLVFSLWPHNAALVTAVIQQIQCLHNGTLCQPTEIRQKIFTFL